MLGIATITMSVNYIVSLSGSVIVGNLVGGDGLAGVSACTPAFGAASFLAALLSVGSGLLFSQAMGAFDSRRAAGVFTQSVTLAVLFGLGIFLTMSVFGGAFLDFTGVTGAVRAQAVAYWRWQAVAMGLLPLVLLMEAMVYADGDGAVAAAAGACHVAGAIGFSVLFARLMGDAGGASAGMAATNLLVLAVSSLHFLRRHSHLRFERYWSGRDFLLTCAGSLPDATIYLCWALLVLIVNKFTIVNFGEGVLPVVALAANVVQFSIVFDGVGEALIPIGGMYDGEGNHPALRHLANYSALMATLEGVCFGIAFYAFAPTLASLYGIRGASAHLLPQAAATIRVLAFAMPFMGFLMMANTHFLIVHRVPFAVSVTVVKDLVLPGMMIFPFGLAFGPSGVWLGIVVGYALAAAYPFAFVRLRHGKSMFPWMIPPDDGKILDISLPVTEPGVRAAQGRIGTFLSGSGVPDLVVKRVMLVVETVGMATVRRNARRRAVAEYSVFLNRPGLVRLVTRDTGAVFDVTAETPSLAAVATSRYLNTLNGNRSEHLVSC